MSSEAAARLRRRTECDESISDAEALTYGREVMAVEAEAVARLAGRLDDEFVAAVRLIMQTGDASGDVLLAGMGKAGLIGQKLAATFASTGTRAHFLHPAEAFHGDLGRVRSRDVVLILSQSGETGEVLQLLPALQETGAPIVAMTASAESSLGRAARIVLRLGWMKEACSLGLAPSTSTTAMLALGDALALTVSRLRGFDDDDFARFHPGGALGLKLSLVDDHMRPLSECRLACESASIRAVLTASTKPGRRSGAVLLTDAEGRLAGLFTDSDLARLIERRQEGALDQPIQQFMSKAPTTVTSGERLTRAIQLLAGCKFSELPVIDAQGHPVGMIDVTDVLDVAPSRDDDASRLPAEPARSTVRLFCGDNREDVPLHSLSADRELPETD